MNSKEYVIDKMCSRQGLHKKYAEICSGDLKVRDCLKIQAQNVKNNLKEIIFCDVN